MAQVNQTVTSGETTGAIIFPGNAQCTYYWTNTAPSIGLPASGTGNIAPFTAINNNNQPVIATISAFASAGQAYIPNSADASVSVISIPTNTITATIPVGIHPVSIAISPDGSNVYVSSNGSNTISVINTSTNTVTYTITLPTSYNPGSIAISPDGKQLYVSCTNDIAVINLLTGDIGLISISAASQNTLSPAGAMVLSPDGTKLYANYNGYVAFIDLVNKSLITLINTGVGFSTPGGIHISKDGSTIYSAVHGSTSGKESFYAIATSTAAIKYSLNSFSVTDFTLNYNDSLIYIPDYVSKHLYILKAATGAAVKIVPIVGSGSQNASLSPDGTLLYVVNADSDNVTVVNTTSDTVVTTIPVGRAPIFSGNFVQGGSGCTPVSFTITVNPVTAYINTTGSLSALNTVYGTASSGASFSVSGTTIGAGGITVTASAGFELSSDDINFADTLVISGANPASVYIRLAAATAAGTYSGNVTLKATGAVTQYVAMPASTVTPAPLTITAVNQTRLYGGDNPTLTVSYSGFVNGDGAAQLTSLPVAATTATAASPAGNYPITLSGASSPNYTITYLDGELTVAPSTLSLVIPNAFTPNNDGVNDTWNIKYLNLFSNCKVYIYNRMGQRVYYSAGYAIPWAGQYNGRNLPAGAYYYIIDTGTAGQKPYSGSVAIIR